MLKFVLLLFVIWLTVVSLKVYFVGTRVCVGFTKVVNVAAPLAYVFVVFLYLVYFPFSIYICRFVLLLLMLLRMWLFIFKVIDVSAQIGFVIVPLVTGVFVCLWCCCSFSIHENVHSYCSRTIYVAVVTIICSNSSCCCAIRFCCCYYVSFSFCCYTIRRCCRSIIHCCCYCSEQ